MKTKLKTSFRGFRYCLPLLCSSIFIGQVAWASCTGSAPTVTCTDQNTDTANNQCKTSGGSFVITGAISAQQFQYNCGTGVLWTFSGMKQLLTGSTTTPPATGTTGTSATQGTSVGSSATAPTNGEAPETTANSNAFADQKIAQQQQLSNQAAQNVATTKAALDNAYQNSNSLVDKADQAQTAADQAASKASGLAQAAAAAPTDTGLQNQASAAAQDQVNAQNAADTANAARNSYNNTDLAAAQNSYNQALNQQNSAQNGIPAGGTTNGNNPSATYGQNQPVIVVQQVPPADPAQKAKDNSVMEGIKADQVGNGNSFSPSTEDCKLSGAVDGKAGCSGMRNTISVTAITAKVASTVGSQAVQMIGQQSQQTAIMNGGSIASIYQSSAAMSAKAAEANIGMGAAQVAMGMVINSQANGHAKEYKNNFHTLKYSGDGPSVAGKKGKGAATGDTQDDHVDIKGSGGTGDTAMGVYNAAITNDDGRNKPLEYSDQMDEHGDARISVTGDSSQVQAAKQKAVLASATSYAHAAATEQNQAAQDGHGAALTNFAQGGGAMVSGTFQYLQAKQMEKLYAQMANAPTITAPGADPFAAPGAISGSNTITGTGTDGSTAAATAATPAPASSAGPLGAPLGNIPTGPAFGTPTDPGTQAAAAPPSSGSPGGAAGGGIGTSAVPGSASDEKPAQYDAQRAAPGYEGVGGFTPGGGSGKGNSNDPSIDPKTLMAAMLDQMNPKKDDDQNPGILNYRNLASDANAPMPAEENFFKRFHDDYQEFQRKGQVGL